MALTDAQKVDIRRHLDYGPMGKTLTAGSFGAYRFFQHYGLLEFRMNNLDTGEELVLLGGSDPNSPVNPNFIDPATDVVHQGFLPICNFLEGQIAVSMDNFDIEAAGSYRSRPDEMEKRVKLYNYWRTRMADFLCLPVNKAKFNGGSGNNKMLVN